MKKDEISSLIDFTAKELIEIVKRECADTMQYGNRKEIGLIVKGILDTRNFKRLIWERVQEHLKKEKK